MKREKLEILTSSAAQTSQAAKLLGQELAEDILIEKKAIVFGLNGDLGSGKTTFIQGLAKGLGIKDKITSPTFVLMKEFHFTCKKQDCLFYHIDCYRLNTASQLTDLGFKDIVNKSGTIIVIEWAEKVRTILPKNTYWLNFQYLDKDKRKITL